MQVQGSYNLLGPCVTGPGVDDILTMASFVTVSRLFMLPRPPPLWLLCHRPRGRCQPLHYGSCATGPGAADTMTVMGLASLADMTAVAVGTADMAIPPWAAETVRQGEALSWSH